MHNVRKMAAMAAYNIALLSVGQKPIMGNDEIFETVKSIFAEKNILSFTKKDIAVITTFGAIASSEAITELFPDGEENGQIKIALEETIKKIEEKEANDMNEKIKKALVYGAVTAVAIGVGVVGYLYLKKDRTTTVIL